MSTTGTDLAAYYERRAPHYDAVYDKPERQADLRRLRELLPARFADRDVLEVAAGTGYWTQFIAATARTIHATDYNAAPLRIAARRANPRADARFAQADAFALGGIEGRFDAGFAGFWWSHMLRSDTARFLRGLCARLEPGSLVAIVDNRYVEGSSQPITRTDDAGNTYQRRTLADGTAHEILKNFPTVAELRAAVTPYGEPEIVELDYYWVVTFATGSS